MNADIYRVSRLLNFDAATAICGAWASLAYAAQDALTVARRRAIAQDARRLIEAFGERRDGKRTSPFGQWLPQRLRCARCQHTTVTRAPIVQVRFTCKSGEDGGASWRCCDCLPEEIRFARGSYSPWARIEVVGAERPEAACAA